jgi:hypothetical protein
MMELREFLTTVFWYYVVARRSAGAKVPSIESEIVVAWLSVLWKNEQAFTAHTQAENPDIGYSSALCSLWISPAEFLKLANETRKTDLPSKIDIGKLGDRQLEVFYDGHAFVIATTDFAFRAGFRDWRDGTPLNLNSWLDDAFFATVGQLGMTMPRQIPFSGAVFSGREKKTSRILLAIRSDKPFLKRLHEAAVEYTASETVACFPAEERALWAQHLEDERLRLVEGMSCQILSRKDVDKMFGDIRERLERLTDGDELFVSANDLSNVFTETDLDRALDRGATVRMMTPDPKSSVAPMLVRLGRYKTVEEMHLINGVVEEKARGLQQTFRDRFAFRYVRVLPAISFFLINAEPSRAMCKVQLCTPQSGIDETLPSGTPRHPHFIIPPNAKYWREYFHRQWAKYWDLALEIDDPKRSE